MKTAVLSLVMVLALSSNAFAVLRPKFPHRPVPPSGQHSTIIIFEDNPVLSPGSRPPR